jgi:phosphoribosylaminoimidazolecarboxamide formyltransferase / IMP cyclohydrolase
MFNSVDKIDDRVPIRRVIVSVFDKTGLDAFIPALVKACPGVVFYSTGGTYDFLKKLLGEDAGKSLVSLAEYTGQPEMQGGLVKSLDFKVYLGLLSEPYNPAHAADLERTGAVAFDLVVSNLYPFESAQGKPGATAEEIRANIDIGGPCLIRAAAKNYLRVAAVVDPADYGRIAEGLEKNGGTIDFAERTALARKAFARIASYDAVIAVYFAGVSVDSLAAPYARKGSSR